MRRIAILLAAALGVGCAASASAQNDESISRPFDDLRGGIVGQFAGLDPLREPVKISARVIPAAGEQPALLAITADVAPNKHIYSLSQPSGGPLPTKIDIEPSREFRLLGPFRADPAPNKRIEKGPVWTGLEIQEHEGQVTWYAPIELTAGVQAASLQVKGTIHTEVCESGGTCESIEKRFTARVAKTGSDISSAIADVVRRAPLPAALASPTPTHAPFQLPSSAVTFSGQIVPSSVRPGESAQIEITAQLPDSGRIYALADRDARVGTKPVLVIVDSASGLLPNRATTQAPLKVDESVPQFGKMQYHEGSVTWTLQIDVPADAPPGEYPIDGRIGYQACEYGAGGNNICELPQALRFAANLNVGDNPSETPGPVAFVPADGYGQVAAAATTFANFLDGQSSSNAAATSNARAIESSPVLSSADQYDLAAIQLDDVGGTLGYYIALAFIGGLILNLMPCVLPVIGLKVMSFVEQAHKSRTHALVLNLWYAAGIVSVFLLLGVLAVSIGLTWGGQFGSTTFNATLAAVVFAMSMSLLGVWEVPIPGFFGSGSVQAAAAQEGPLGAFLKGVVTTVLATPCTAPIMATAVAWAVTQPVGYTLLVFASLGLGMASPYLLVGVYPELLRFLPKPGVWMETFKQISGFILLATVVFILSFVEPAAVVPTVALLLGVGIACWSIGRTSPAAEFGDRLRSWIYAGAMVGVFTAISFGWLYRDVMLPRFANQVAASPAAADGNWQPFSLERLKQLTDAGKTVLVDFSADWCFNCKVLEQAVLHTEPVEKAISELDVVTMYADYTDYPPEIDRTIKALGANGVPVIAVFPGSTPHKPIVFRGGYTQQRLVNAIETASGRKTSPVVAEVGAMASPMN